MTSRSEARVWTLLSHCWHGSVVNKGKTPSRVVRGGPRRFIAGIRRRILMPASDLPTRTTRWVGVFLLYRNYLWNKQQVMSINLTTWTTMQYHVVVDHIVFYMMHSQVRYKIKNLVCFAFIGNSCCLFFNGNEGMLNPLILTCVLWPIVTDKQCCGVTGHFDLVYQRHTAWNGQSPTRPIRLDYGLS